MWFQCVHARLDVKTLICIQRRVRGDGADPDGGGVVLLHSDFLKGLSPFQSEEPVSAEPASCCQAGPSFRDERRH